MKKTFLKKMVSAQVILLIVSFGFVQNVLAGYEDAETMVDNVIGASSLDAEVTSEDTELQLANIAKNMIGGDSVSREGKIKNVGRTEFLYNVKFVKIDGVDTLCDGLQLEAKKDENV